MKKLLCRVGLHAWSYPGGPCADCGKADEIFGPGGEHEINLEQMIIDKLRESQGE